jgi:hypothetical protein
VNENEKRTRQREHHLTRPQSVRFSMVASIRADLSRDVPSVVPSHFSVPPILDFMS